MKKFIPAVLVSILSFSAPYALSAESAEFTDYTGLAESVVRPAIDEALAKGYISETADEWQITEHGKLFLNSLLELFLGDE